MTSSPLRIGSLCTGYGGLDLATSAVSGGHLAWTADPDPGAAAVLAHHWPDIPNLGDITRVDWTCVEPVDVLTAGFPCQDISHAGRGAGIRKGTRSGLWHHITHAVRALRPRYLVLENVAAIVARRPGLDVVLTDLARLGLDAEWTCLRASDVGAPHERNRWFLVAADPARLRHQRPGHARHRRSGPAHRRDAPAHPDSTRRQGTRPGLTHQRPLTADRARWGRYAPAIARWEHLIRRPAPDPTEPGRNGPRLAPRFVEWLMGLPAGWVTEVPGLSRTQQLHLLGNGVVPQQGAVALTGLLARLADTPPHQEHAA